MLKRYLLVIALMGFASTAMADTLEDTAHKLDKDLKDVSQQLLGTTDDKFNEDLTKIHDNLHAAKVYLTEPQKDTLDSTIKVRDYAPLVEATVETTKPAEHYNWWKWLGWLALLGGLLALLGSTRRRRYNESEYEHHRKRDSHKDKDVEYVVEEIQYEKGTDHHKRHYNKDHKKRD